MPPLVDELRELLDGGEIRGKKPAASTDGIRLVGQRQQIVDDPRVEADAPRGERDELARLVVGCVVEAREVAQEGGKAGADSRTSASTFAGCPPPSR